MLSDPGVTRAAVIGAGMMGRRIAAVLAAGGLDVALCDADPATLAAGVATAGEVAAQIAAGRAAAAPGRVTAVAAPRAAVAGAGLVIEAVVEDLAVKRDLFREISCAANPDALLATNTSVLPVTAIAEDATGPHRVLGTHWWNPPDLIPVVEVIPGRLTDPASADRMARILERLGKTPVLVRRDVPGFIGNRLQHALWREAIALVADGICDAETVDMVARNTIGLRLARLGPIENADFVGLDLTLAIHETVLAALDASPDPSPLLRDLVVRGDLGARTGRGFLPWTPGDREAAARNLAAHLAAQIPSAAARCAGDLPDPAGTHA